MSIKRKDIRAIMEDETLDADAKAKKLLDMIHDETDSIRDERDEIQKQLDEANATITTEKAAKEKAEKDLNTYKDQQNANAAKSAKESAYLKLLTDAGVGEKHRNLIMRATDLSALEMAEDGKLKDADKLAETIKTDYADYISTTTVSGADVSNPPKNHGETDLGAMSMAEYIAARKK